MSRGFICRESNGVVDELTVMSRGAPVAGIVFPSVRSELADLSISLYRGALALDEVWPLRLYCVSLCGTLLGTRGDDDETMTSESSQWLW
ncbi:hypothetical protein V6N13_141997 [Hibiscus sabdariffa]|uniref:Uncharacterized protein n=1 Tax=Hibiscus sabdariffa TaxID=183260 RepID=A0ABR2FCX7_9ROSI